MIYKDDGRYPSAIVYARTGNLATTTQLDQERAQGFVKLADLRRSIVITDSDVEPESDVVAVGLDTLAWRRIAPIEKLTEFKFTPKPLYTLTRQDRAYRLAIHDQIIDDMVRKKGVQNKNDYEQKYLSRLNQAVYQGVTEALFQEKLGWLEQRISYRGLLIYLAGLPVNAWSDYLTDSYQSRGMWLGIILFVLNPTLNYVLKIYSEPMKSINRLLPEEARLPIPSSFPERDFKGYWLPILPIERWLYGRNLIVPAESTSQA